jgi:hypothetical protein
MRSLLAAGFLAAALFTTAAAQVTPTYIEPGYHLSYQLTWDNDSLNLSGIRGVDDIYAGLDLNKNGKKEILFVDDPSNCAISVDPALFTIYLYENDGNDSYKQIWRATIPTPCNSFPALGWSDFDNDGNMEIIAALPAQVDASAPVLPRLYFFEYDSAAHTFPSTPTLTWNMGLAPTIDFRPSALTSGDFDGDGLNEIAFINRAPGTRKLTVIQLIGDDLGGFSSVNVEFVDSSASLQGGGNYDLKVVDFDGDGKKEIWAITWNLLQLSVYEAQGPDTYTYKKGLINLTPGADNGSLNALHFGDFDNDGHMEAFMAGTEDQIFFLKEDVADVGDLTPALFHTIGGGNGDQFRGAGVGDPDRDGKVDFFFTDNASRVYHMEYKGSGAMTDPASYDNSLFIEDTFAPTRYYYLSVPPEDMDGDNKREVVVGSLEQSNVDAMFVVIESDVSSGIFRDSLTVPNGYSLEQNYPNPFNPSTAISFIIPATQTVTLIVYDLQGQEVRRILDNKGLGAARYTVIWDGKDAHGLGVPSGAYFYTLKARDFSQTRKMMLVR